MVVGELLDLVRDPELAQPPHEPAHPEVQLPLVVAAAIEKQELQAAKRLRVAGHIDHLDGVVLAPAAPHVGVVLLHAIGAETWARWLPALEPLLPRLLEGGDGARSSSSTALALVGCMAALHFVGLVDDRRGLGAGPKLLVQAASPLRVLRPVVVDQPGEGR